jgi:hypothetical protein
VGARKLAALGKFTVAAALAAAFCSASAKEAEEQARDAAIADGVSTAVGLAVGATELNPLGPILAFGMKTAVFEYTKTRPDTERPAAYAAAASVWSGAAANNLCVAAAIVTGGTFGPVCIAVGVAWGMKTWKDSEHERLFWEGCAMLREYAGEPTLECIYTPPETQLARQESPSMVSAQALEAP